MSYPVTDGSYDTLHFQVLNKCGASRQAQRKQRPANWARERRAKKLVTGAYISSCTCRMQSSTGTEVNPRASSSSCFVEVTRISRGTSCCQCHMILETAGRCFKLFFCCFMMFLAKSLQGNQSYTREGQRRRPDVFTTPHCSAHRRPDRAERSLSARACTGPHRPPTPRRVRSIAPGALLG